MASNVWPNKTQNSVTLYSRPFTIWTQLPSWLPLSSWNTFSLFLHLSKSQSSFKIITSEQLFPVSLVSRCPCFWSASVSITVVVITWDVFIVKCLLCLSASSLRDKSYSLGCPLFPAPSHRTWHSAVRKGIRPSVPGRHGIRRDPWVCVHMCVCTSVCVCVCAPVHVSTCSFLPLLIRRGNPEENKGLRVCSLYRPGPLFFHPTQPS